jgi:DNA-binding beta-propeller fold protein YncE
MKPLLAWLACLLVVETYAASWRAEIIAGGPAAEVKLNQPFGIVRGPDGCIYFCEIAGAVVRKIDKQGVVTTIASGFKQPHEIRFDKHGDLYVADTGNGRIVKVDLKTGALAPVPAKFRTPISLQFDARGELLVCDIGVHKIQKLDTQTGEITTVVGAGIRGPRSIDFDRDGHLWVALREGNQVLKINRSTGAIDIIAGTGKGGLSGDSGPAKQATLSGPKGIAVAPDCRRVFLADTESHTIRVIDLKTGTIERVWGTGKRGGSLEQLARPHALFAETDGSLLVSDSENNRVLALRPVP